METITSMDVEEQQPSPKPNNVKHFSLKNSIQTNFGDDYVFQIIPKDDWSAIAVSLSTNAVKLYSPVVGQYYGECKGHSGTINQVLFSGPSNPHVLSSCSSDGTIRAWDTRSFQQVSVLNAGPSQEVFSFSTGGPNGSLVAAGCDSQVLLWDWRNNKQIACLEDSHMDDVTQVHFVPDEPGKLISASVDGLICIFDTSGDINDDDHLDSVINVGTSIAKAKQAVKAKTTAKPKAKAVVKPNVVSKAKPVTHLAITVQIQHPVQQEIITVPLPLTPTSSLSSHR